MQNNQNAIDMYNQMAEMGAYYSSGRPVAVNPEIIVEDVLSKLPVTKNDVVLDVGCGTGVITIPLSKHCKSIHALDSGEKVIEKAKSICQNEGINNITYYLGSALDLPFKENTFDYVLMYGVLHIFNSIDQAQDSVAQIVKVCKPGGKILIGEIPDQGARQEFEQRPKTPEEIKLLNEFNANRGEYDRLLKEHTQRVKGFASLVVDCRGIIEYAEKLGCQGTIQRQDIRQPLSLTRRDIVLTKNK